MNLRQVNDITQHHIVSGSEYLWSCYPDPHTLDYENEFASLSVVFNKKTQEVYEANVCFETGPLRDARPYRWLNPEYKDTMISEAKKRNVKWKKAWDDVKWVELEVEEDFLHKAENIFNGHSDFDKRIQVPVDLEDEVLFKLCMEAHKRDITLNQLVEEVLRAMIDVNE